MNCPACNESNPDTRKFCRACGAQPSLRCESCGAANEKGDRFCGECGASLGQLSPSPSPPSPQPSHLGNEERRPVTILFADIVGFTALSERLDAEVVRDITTDCLGQLVRQATEHGGTIDKFMGDAVMVLFGAPTAHEDDPLRAVRAGRAMLRALERFNEGLSTSRGFQLNLRIGIETGEVVTGERVVQSVREYTAIGDAVNVAARLQSATAPGTILIGPGTERHVRNKVGLESVPSLELKGKAERMPAWLVVADSPLEANRERSRSAPLVGRDAELRSLQSCLTSLREGRGQILLVIGDPGLGKSRLVAEARSAASDLPWWRCAAFAHEGTTSYGLVRSMLAQLCAQAYSDAPASMEAIIERVASLGGGEEIPLLARILGYSSEGIDVSRASAAGPTELQGAITSAFSRVLEDLTDGGPTVLELDDLHWSDPSSIELLTELAGLTERLPLLICGVMRAEMDAPSWGFRERVARRFPDRVSEVQLSPLTHESARNLAAALLGAEQLPAELSSILERAAGTPLWLEELVRTLIEREIVTSRGSTWSLSDSLAQLEIPDTLQGLIIARLDRLGEARVAIQTASVIGRNFTNRVLAHIAAGPSLDEHLGQASRADIIYELATLPEREYAFKHVLVQEATYSTLLFRRRRELHRRVAEALAELQADSMESLHPTLSYHYQMAEDWPRAFEHARAAAERARASFANREALAHLTNALSALERLGRQGRERLEILRLRAETANDLGDFDSAQADYSEAREIAVTLNDPVSEAHLVGALAMLWAGHRDYEEGLRLAEEAVRIATMTGDARELATAHVRVATALLNLNREARCQESLETALKLVRSISDQAGEAQTLDLLGMAGFVFGNLQSALHYSERAMPLLHLTGDRWTEASSAIVRGISHAFRGELEEGRHWVHWALDAWQEMDAIPGIAFGHACVAEIEEPVGRFQIALEHARAGLEIARGIEHLEWTCMGLWLLGRVHRSCWLLDSSERYLREMVDVASSLQSTLWMSLAHGELGTTLLEAGRRDEAAPELTTCRGGGSGADMATAQASVSLARLALENDRPADALALARSLAERREGFLVLGLDAQCIAGQSMIRLGRENEGRELLVRSLEQARTWEARPAAVRLHTTLGLLLRDAGDHAAAREHGRRARAILDQTIDELTDSQLHQGLSHSPAARTADELLRS